MNGSPPESRRIVRTASAVLGALLTCGVARAAAATAAGDLMAWPEGVRVFRALGRNGKPSVVITNLDEAGNPLPGASSPAPPVARNSPECLPAGNEAPEAPRDRGGDADEAGGAAGAGTTIVININNVPAAPPPLPVYAVPVAYGGLVGPFRYPENHPFLGYGTGTASPSMFGGLGLNSGNRFGLKTGTPCGAGFDCMFGPGPSRP